MSCVVVCAERHTGTSAPARARIRILADLLGNVDARYCRQCEDASCAAVCPEEAIAFDETIHAWLVNEEKCLACGLCVEACPYEAIVLDPVTDKATKCDLCLGAVHCVEICPTKALSVIE